MGSTVELCIRAQVRVSGGGIVVANRLCQNSVFSCLPHDNHGTDAAYYTICERHETGWVGGEQNHNNIMLCIRTSYMLYTHGFPPAI